MQRRRRIALAATASSVLVAGALTGLALTVTAGSAQADGVTSCQGTGAPVACTLTSVTVTSPSDIYLEATYSPNTGGVNISYTITCTLNGTPQTITSASTKYTASPAYVFPVIQPADPNSCSVTATASVPGTTLTAGSPSPSPSASPTPVVGTLTFAIDDDPNSSATASASPTPSASKTTTAPSVKQARGFDGKCLDDFGNKSAKRTKIGIWSCSSTDAAQGWTYSSDELKIHGLCLNAKGNGKSGSKTILWSCNGSANEIWIHKSNQEYELKANGYKLCLDDPGYSIKNGTQLMVYACNNGPNQHWSLP
jgi:Ricin-type beta-trefoil lectin domain